MPIKINKLCWDALMDKAPKNCAFQWIRCIDKSGLASITSSNGEFVSNPFDIISLNEIPDIQGEKHFTIEFFGDGERVSVYTGDYQPKIRMTKELPTEVGYCYWCSEDKQDIEIVEVESSKLHNGGALYVDCCEAGLVDIDRLGGYWAKVEQDQFEFVD